MELDSKKVTRAGPWESVGNPDKEERENAVSPCKLLSPQSDCPLIQRGKEVPLLRISKKLLALLTNWVY